MSEKQADPNRPFPMQGSRGIDSGWIPWWLAEIAYVGYAVRYGTDQSLERLAERGGFGWAELGSMMSLDLYGDEKLHPSDHMFKKIKRALNAAWRKTKKHGIVP